jgi:hypothetical protein
MMLRITTGLLATLLALPLFAQDDPDTGEDVEIRRYTAEVIVFRYAQDVATGGEVFLPEEAEEPGLLEEQMLVMEEAAPPPAAARGPLPDTEFVLLSAGEYQMGEILDRLERLDVYEPLMHFGWTQATWPEEQTEPVSLHRFARPPAGLDGELTLYLGRFLHLVIDLQLEAPKSASADTRLPPGIADYDALQDFESRDAARPVFYSIQEDRILRSGELRYYDHPKFGVLARVTRVEEEDEEEEPEGELLGYPLQ